MAIRTEIVGFEGAAGRVDCALDWPEGAPRGWALVLHPHSLQGGARGQLGQGDQGRSLGSGTREASKERR